MNWQRIKEDWPRLRDSARERWPRLEKETLEQAAGNRTRLMEALQEEYGWTLERAGIEVDRWADNVSEHGAAD
jgi:uncharacterized protein YjbJ (UPF0337 family)